MILCNELHEEGSLVTFDRHPVNGVLTGETDRFCGQLTKATTIQVGTNLGMMELGQAELSLRIQRNYANYLGRPFDFLDETDSHLEMDLLMSMACLQGMVHREAQSLDPMRLLYKFNPIVIMVGSTSMF